MSDTATSHTTVAVSETTAETRYFDLERDSELVIVYLDQPGARVNTLSRAMLQEFGEVLTTLENDSTLKGAVLISRKPDSFVVGADIKEFGEFRTPDEVQDAIREGHVLFGRLAALAKPVVAAVHGAAVGGGLELILACRYRLATDHPKTRFALPEVNLGLLPGLGGTQRLPRLVGVQAALEMMLSGKTVYPKPAKKMGLIDALIHPPGLLEGAKRAARALISGKINPERGKQPLTTQLLERIPLSRVVYQRALESVEKRTHGNYPAPAKIIAAVRAGQERGMKAGLEAEAQGFSELLFTSESRALVHLFFAKNAAEKNPYQGAARPVKKVGVLGAGLMGSGIAQISAQGGHAVVMKDHALAYTAKGKAAIWRDLDKRVGKGLSAFERDTIAERVVATTDYAPFAKTDLVIEAVLEDLPLKQQVLKEVEAVARKTLVYASNTSSIPIRDIAAASQRPEQVVGMHYFSPAQKLPLLEIIKKADTPEWVLATAFATGLEQGKTVIVVGDAPGFYTTRIVALYMNEALVMLEEGADIRQLDRTMRAFGFPVGPITLLDEVGIDVGAKINEVLKDFLSARKITPSSAGKTLSEADYKGRKNKRGFYSYDSKGGKDKAINADIYRYFGGPTRKQMDPKEIKERLALVMVNEAVRCLEEGVLSSPRDGDVGAVFGLGFPPFLGGPFWYSDTRGPGEVMGALRGLEYRFGPRFRPAELLKEHAANGTRFYDLAPVAAP